MPEITKLKFSLSEIAQTLLRQQGITAGHWELGVSFNLNVSNVAVTENSALPSVLVQVEALNLAQVSQPTPNSIDASQVSSVLTEWPTEV